VDHLDLVAGQADQPLDVVRLAVARSLNTMMSPRLGCEANSLPGIAPGARSRNDGSEKCE